MIFKLLAKVALTNSASFITFLETVVGCGSKSSTDKLPYVTPILINSCEYSLKPCLEIISNGRTVYLYIPNQLIF